jgi:hypothetical protein
LLTIGGRLGINKRMMGILRGFFGVDNLGQAVAFGRE